MGEIRGDGRTAVDRTERELVVTRTFNGPVRLVFDAWTKAELFQLWWAPKSSGVPMLACDMDVRVGGGYSVTFGKDPANTMTFFGKYTEVVPNARLVWTNEEGGDISVTTVTFQAMGDQTLLVMRELYPSKEALNEAFVGMEGGTPEQFNQLDDLLATLAAGA
jgi:uncharacterized protein YndB with AHSA1/START domain